MEIRSRSSSTVISDQNGLLVYIVSLYLIFLRPLSRDGWLGHETSIQTCELEKHMLVLIYSKMPLFIPQSDD